MSTDDHPNPCEFCMGKIVGSHGEIYTCDDCPIVTKKVMNEMSGEGQK